MTAKAEPAMRNLTVRSLFRRIDLFSLKLFLTAVEEGKVGRAAFREHLAPSAATKRIQDLEDLLGLKLFERTNKGVAPSQAGLVVAQHARAIFAVLDDLRRDLSEFSVGMRGTVGIAATGMLIVQFLAKEISEFHRRFPLVEIDLRQETHADALRTLTAGEVDFAVFSHYAGASYDGIESFECRSDRLVAIVPVTHPLAQHASIALETLLDHELIGIGENTTTMSNLRLAARRIGRELNLKFSVTAVDVVLSLVAEGLGITVLPASLPVTGEGERVTTVHLDGDWAERSYRIGTLAGKQLTPAAAALVDQIATSSVAPLTQASDLPISFVRP